MQFLVDFNALSWETQTGFRHKIIKQGSNRLRLIEYTKHLEPHWCEKGHCGFVLDGKLEISFNTDVVVFNPGDGILIPDGAEYKHMLRILSDVARVFLVEDA